MSHSPLFGTRKHLVSQLAFFDEQHAIFLDTYCQQYGKERQQLDQLIRQYVSKLEEILVGDDEQLGQSLQQIVLMGSTVTVVDLEDASSEEYTVVYPTEADPDHNRISFLSPFGRRLLLASYGDELVIDSPTSQYSIKLDRIKFGYMGGFSDI